MLAWGYVIPYSVRKIAVAMRDFFFRQGEAAEDMQRRADLALTQTAMNLRSVVSDSGFF